MLYVSALDAQAEGALKVIAYYDALVEHGASLEACVRASASLGQCTAGLHDQQAPWPVRYDRTGSLVGGEPAPSIRAVVRVGSKAVGEVWLERPGPQEVLDELVVERFALAAAALWKTPRPARSVASVLETIFSGSATAKSRDRALEHWGFCTDRPLAVGAVATNDVGVLAEASSLVAEAMAGDKRSMGKGFVWAALGNVAAIVVQPSDGSERSELPSLVAAQAEARIGLARNCEASRLPEGWQQAQVALHFAGVLGFGTVVDHSELGCLALLGDMAPDVVAAHPEVQVMAQLAKGHHGSEMVKTLEAVLAHDSVRQAAAAMYMHPSSLHYRIDQMEALLGFSVKSPRGKLRAALAIALWRLSTQ